MTGWLAGKMPFGWREGNDARRGMEKSWNPHEHMNMMATVRPHAHPPSCSRLFRCHHARWRGMAMAKNEYSESGMAPTRTALSCFIVKYSHYTSQFLACEFAMSPNATPSNTQYACSHSIFYYCAYM